MKKRKDRDWNKMDPVEYYHKYYSNIKIRKQLQEEDSGLYTILYKRKRINEVIPNTVNRDWSKTDPVKLFYEKHSHVVDRNQLYKEDSGLYAKLKEARKLDEVLPKNRRDWSKTDPIRYLKKNHPHIKSVAQLQKEDKPLYDHLLKTKRVSEAFPDRKKTKNWEGINLIEYTHKHYPNVKTKKQLEKLDGGLYSKLLKTKKINKIFPNEKVKRDWSKIDLVDYYHTHYSHIKSSGQLNKEDGSFYNLLLKSGILKSIFPSKEQQKAKALELVIEEYLKE